MRMKNNLGEFYLEYLLITIEYEFFYEIQMRQMHKKYMLISIHITPNCDYGPTAAIRSKIDSYDTSIKMLKKTCWGAAIMTF
eukprot:UN13481